MKTGRPHGFSSPQCRAASYVQRPLTTAPILAIVVASHSAPAPAGSPRGSSAYVHGPPNTQ
jgi:hypothetical protein